MSSRRTPSARILHPLHPIAHPWRSLGDTMPPIMRLALGLTVVLFLLASAEAAAQPAVSWLSPLVGAWAHDRHLSSRVRASRSSRAAAERAAWSCMTPILSAKRSSRGANGTGRTYRFLINYNRTTSRFEMLSIWSNVPHKAVQTLAPNSGRDRWIIEDLAVIGDDGSSNEHWSELVIESADRIVWTGQARDRRRRSENRTDLVSRNLDAPVALTYGSRVVSGRGGASGRSLNSGLSRRV